MTCAWKRERERAQLCACVDFWVKLAPGGGSRERERPVTAWALAWAGSRHNITLAPGDLGSTRCFGRGVRIFYINAMA